LLEKEVEVGAEGFHCSRKRGRWSQMVGVARKEGEIDEGFDCSRIRRCAQVVVGGKTLQLAL
jgi:hypothetical protein